MAISSKNLYEQYQLKNGGKENKKKAAKKAENTKTTDNIFPLKTATPQKENHKKEAAPDQICYFVKRGDKIPIYGRGNKIYYIGEAIEDFSYSNTRGAHAKLKIIKVEKKGEDKRLHTTMSFVQGKVKNTKEGWIPTKVRRDAISNEKVVKRIYSEVYTFGIPNKAA